MKTMKDFKGTSGEFRMEYPFIDSDQLFIVTGRLPLNFVAEIKAPDTWLKVEAEANARLFANAKKVLEAAISSYNELTTITNHMRINSAYFNLADKQGLENWNRFSSIMIKLETVINDSL